MTNVIQKCMIYANNNTFKKTVPFLIVWNDANFTHVIQLVSYILHLKILRL